jgi:hypothetical protein
MGARSVPPFDLRHMYIPTVPTFLNLRHMYSTYCTVFTFASEVSDPSSVVVSIGASVSVRSYCNTHGINQYTYLKGPYINFNEHGIGRYSTVTTVYSHHHSSSRQLTLT